MQTFKQFLIEGPTVEQAQKILAQAKQQAASPSANWQTRDELRFAYEELAKAKQQVKRNSGEIKSVSIDVPEDKATQIHSELHKMWKGQDGYKIPWGTFHSNKEGVTEFKFDDYEAGNEAIEKLIAHVKASQ